MNPSSKFWDRIAKRYARRPVADEAAYNKKLEVTREYLRPGMEVLEFGCGTGTTAIAHAPHVKHIRATDISGQMLEIAQRKASAANIRNVSFERASIEDLRVAGRSVDVVMGHSILHLVADREAVIDKVYRMLKPGGVFVSSTMCLADSHNLFRPVLPLLSFFGVIPVVKFFTSDALVASLESAGFTIAHRWQPDKGSAVFIVAKKAG